MPLVISAIYLLETSQAENISYSQFKSVVKQRLVTNLVVGEKKIRGVIKTEGVKDLFDMGKRLGSKAPRIFYVNWFRKTSDGKWLWPGFGANSRVLKWMCERIEGKVGARKTPIGYLPNEADLDLKGLTIQPDHVRELLKVGPQPWKAEVQDIKKFFAQFGSRLPERLREQLRGLATRLEQQELRDEWRIIWVINFMWVVCPIQSLKRSWKRSFPSTALLYQHV
ncbi:MAG TPA: phosphoenolpyruvate carboxykinase domain-containing protein [Candidatus Binatia bacterium]|nr:phosphoenolpyruvate carboxykinase domain-containing protein [Candidatus Binatia bacterium]